LSDIVLNNSPEEGMMLDSNLPQTFGHLDISQFEAINNSLVFSLNNNSSECRMIAVQAT